MYHYAGMLGTDVPMDPHTDDTLGRQLARLRKQAGYTSQRELAVVVGVSEAMISHVEAGRRLPSHGTLVNIFEAIGADEATRRRLEALRLQEATSPPSTASLILSHLAASTIEGLARRLDAISEQLDQTGHQLDALSRRLDAVEHQRRRSGR